MSSAFSFSNGGTTTSTGLGVGGGTISMETHGPDATWGNPPALAMTQVYRNPTTHYIVDWDQVYNSYYSYSDGASVGNLDMRSLARHELGHGLGLDHVADFYGTQQAMHLGLCTNAAININWGDNAGIRNHYPNDDEGYYLLDETGAVFALGGANSINHVNAPYYGGPNANNVIGYPTNKATYIDLARPRRDGYRVLASNGGVFSYGSAPFKGSAAGFLCGTCQAVQMASGPDSSYYWVLGSDGGIFAFPSPGAPFYGSAAGLLPAGTTAVAIAARPQGDGYWIVNNVGQVYAFGGAPYRGNVPAGTQTPIRGIVSSQSGGGYCILANDSGVFCFGDGSFQGSQPGFSAPRAIGRDPLGPGYAVISNGSGVSNGSTFTGGFTNYGRGTTPTAYAGIAATRKPIPPDFSIGANPSTVTVQRGTTATSTITLTSNNAFYANMSYSVSGAPSGVSASVSPSSVLLPAAASASSTLSITVPSTYLTPLNFTLTVNACGAGICHSTNVSVVVTL